MMIEYQFMLSAINYYDSIFCPFYILANSFLLFIRLLNSSKAIEQIKINNKKNPILLQLYRALYILLNKGTLIILYISRMWLPIDSG